MTVTNVLKDADKLEMTIVAEFGATPERIWQLWADPRQLERWWGPPEYPATFTTHDLRPGGRVSYFMTGPNGEQAQIGEVAVHGYWDVIEVDPPRFMVLKDGFADENDEPNTDFPVGGMRVTIDDIGGGRTRMSIQSEFPDAEAMEQMLAMGMEEGIRSAVGQIDAILEEIPVA